MKSMKRKTKMIKMKKANIEIGTEPIDINDSIYKS